MPRLPQASKLPRRHSGAHRCSEPTCRQRGLMVWCRSRGRGGASHPPRAHLAHSVEPVLLVEVGADYGDGKREHDEREEHEQHRGDLACKR